jgi:hypothetical protein
MSGDAADSGAYIRVRVPGGPRPGGSILVYLPDGTGLVVNSNQLLRLDAASVPGTHAIPREFRALD